jgi:hypothetical protein
MQNSRHLGPIDVKAYCWNQLSRFENTELVAKKISSLHGISISANVKKQAAQVGYCTSLAKEYFRASKSVSLHTKPLLLYYSLMHFALAEILMKQDGLSSLDAAREKHRHHGLLFSTSFAKKIPLNFVEACQGLHVKPLITETGERSGTFELWHRSARPYPMCGSITSAVARAQWFGPVLSSGNERYPLIPKAGLNVLSAFEVIPGLSMHLSSISVKNALVRATFSRTQKIEEDIIEVMVHPDEVEKIHLLYNSIEVPASDVPYFDVEERQSGFHLVIRIPKGQSINFNMPHGVNYNSESAYLCPKDTCFNEFGAFYVAFFALSNLSRYFPDLWMPEVQSAGELSVVVEALCDQFEERVPLLILSELERTFIVS